MVFDNLSSHSRKLMQRPLQFEEGAELVNNITQV